MTRYDRFTFLCNTQERQTIANLARHLRRSQSDAVRFVLMEAARQLFESKPQSATQTGQGWDAGQVEDGGVNVPANP